MTNIKPKSYYHAANDLHPGWGRYLLRIDRLKDKKKDFKPFTLSEFCWTLHADGWCSSVWESFLCHAKRKKRNKHEYTSWRTIFNDWFTSYDH